MKKEDVYKLRSLFEKIEGDFANDRSDDRATKIFDSVKKGVELCNTYINKMKPL
jgi:hypothetical protein